MKVKEHLTELKKELLKIIIPAVALFVLFFYLAKPMILFVLNFYNLPIQNIVSLNPFESIQTSLMVSGSLTLLFLLPLIIQGVLRFSREAIGDKVYKKAKGIVIKVWLLSIVGVIIGISLFSKLVLTNMIMEYTLTTPQWSILSVFSFIIISSITLALAMQMIIILPSMVSIDLIKRTTLKKIRPFVFIFILVFSAMATPPDVISMFIMTVPIYLAYELGIAFSKTKLEDNITC